jgi:hypothetical protein
MIFFGATMLYAVAVSYAGNWRGSLGATVGIAVAVYVMIKIQDARLGHNRQAGLWDVVLIGSVFAIVVGILLSGIHFTWQLLVSSWLQYGLVVTQYLCIALTVLFGLWIIKSEIAENVEPIEIAPTL